MKNMIVQNTGSWAGWLDEGLRLANTLEEHGGWFEYFDPDKGLEIKDQYLLASTALMLENEKRWMASKCKKRIDERGNFVIDEATRSASVGGFSDYLFPIIRAGFPVCPVNELVSVQPTTRRTATIIYWNFIVGRTKGSYVQGQRINDANRGRQDIGFNYSNDVIDAEGVGTGTGSSAVITGSLAYHDGGGVRPGSVRLVAQMASDDSFQTVSDNANGGFLGGITGSIDYVAGTFSVTFSGNVKSGTSVIAGYRWNMEGSASLPEMDVATSITTVETVDRKMKLNYSTEAMQDVMAELGVALEPTLISACSENMNYEIAREIIHQIWSVASVVSTFPLSPPSTQYNQQDHFKDFIYYLAQASNVIQRKTQKAYGNWIVVDEGAANMIESLPGGMFEAAPRPKNIQGMHFIGTLMKKYRVYKDMFLVKEAGASSYGNILMGYKGTGFEEAGFVWSPYQLLYQTDALTTADFMTQKGMGTRYATKMVNPEMYVRISLGV